MPTTTPYVAAAQTGLADVLVDAGRHLEGERLARTALVAWQISYADDHWQLASARLVLAKALVGTARYAEAQPLLTQAQAALLAGLGPDNWRTRQAGTWLSRLYDDWDTEAQPSIARAPEQ